MANTIFIDKLNVNKGTWQNLTVNVDMANVKDVQYFRKGLQFIAFQKAVADINKRIDKAEKEKSAILEKCAGDTMKALENLEYIVASNNIDDWKKLRSEVGDMTSSLELPEDVTKAVENDNFLHVVGASIGICKGGDVALWKEAENAISAYGNKADVSADENASREEFFAMKSALEKCANVFASAENEYYTPVKLHVNVGLCKRIYKASYKRSSMDVQSTKNNEASGNAKHGAFYGEGGKSEFIVQMIGRLQKLAEFENKE